VIDLEIMGIDGDSGPILLGDEAAVRAHVHEWYASTYDIKPIGWMHDVGWDRERYEFKREFIAESGYGSWWEGCTAPADGTESKRCRRAWELVCP
jgi:hypothetical protein